MWVSVIYPNDDFSSTSSSYWEEVYFKSSPLVPEECFNSALLYRFFEDDFFDEASLIAQGFHKCRKNIFVRSLTREDYLFILNNILDFNWT